MSKPSNDAKSRRYTIAQRAEILAFIEQYNRAKGRGGQRAAHQKFGIAQLTLKNWMRYGVVSRKVGAPFIDRTGNMLERLQDLHRRIEKEQARLDRLKAEYERVKSEF